jgi:hypothetical protein
MVTRIHQNESVETILQKLADFVSPPGVVDYIEQFNSRNRNKGEAADKYAQALRTLAEYAYPDCPQAQREKWLISRFRSGQPQAIRCQLSMFDFVSLDACVKAVMSYEDTIGSVTASRSRPTVNAVVDDDAGQYVTGDDYSGNEIETNDYHEIDVNRLSGRPDKGRGRGSGRGFRTSQTPHGPPNRNSNALDALTREVGELRRSIHQLRQGGELSEQGVNWADFAIAMTTQENGTIDEFDVYAALSQTVDRWRKSDTNPQVCFFCQQAGHRWLRCPVLRAHLVRNGMINRKSNNSENKLSLNKMPTS